MSINQLFRKRIGFQSDEILTFDKLDTILEKTAKTIPFENLCIINNSSKAITKENLTEKIITRNEGGVCYEINTILHFFLKENGFDVELVRGRTYNHAAQAWSPAGRTHILNLLSYEGEKYAVDSGFGGNLPLKPVPLSDKVVSSKSGDFRLRCIDSEDGDFLLELKLKHRDQDWVNGYIFESTRPVLDESELNEVQQIIVESPFSPFNKTSLATRFTDQGNIILTETSLTQRIDGKEHKEVFSGDRFNKLAKLHFGLQVE